MTCKLCGIANARRTAAGVRFLSLISLPKDLSYIRRVTAAVDKNHVWSRLTAYRVVPSAQQDPRS